MSRQLKDAKQMFRILRTNKFINLINVHCAIVIKYFCNFILTGRVTSRLFDKSKLYAFLNCA